MNYPHTVLTKVTWSMYHCLNHTEEETEAQRGEMNHQGDFLSDGMRLSTGVQQVIVLHQFPGRDKCSG